MQTKIIAIDTFYYSDKDAYSVGVLFNNWQDSKPQSIVSCHTTDFAPYIPGEFYKRELPCILDLLSIVNLNEINTILLDGFVKLPDNKDGLGMHLWKKLGNIKISIVGLAKSKFKDCEKIALPVFRGNCISPMWVNTNQIISNEEAVSRIKQMHGNYRMPDLLKVLDRETKKFKEKGI